MTAVDRVLPLEDATPVPGAARIAIACPHPAETAQLASLIVEGGRHQLVAATDTLPGAAALARDGAVDAVVLHEELGPLGVFDNLRSLVSQAPAVGVVVLVREETPQAYRTALRGGARGLLRTPPTVEDLHAALDGALDWSRVVSAGVGAPVAGEGPGGRLVVVAGAKGGVGTSLIAVLLAQSLLEGRRLRVCLVDFDLQSGDVGSLLGLQPRRTVIDLLALTDETDRGPIEEGLSAHESGLRVLLAPEEGEQAERVDTAAARRILGALRALFDVVVVDVGTVVSEAGASATEVADASLLVVTPDALAMRGATRLVALWERLRVRGADCRILVNRASRRSEVQGDLIGRVTRLPVLRTQIPAGFWELEPIANGGGTFSVFKPGPVRTAIARVRDELGYRPGGAAVDPTARRRRSGLRRAAAGEGGYLTAEFVAMLGLVTVSVLLLLQALLIGLTLVIGQHAAREGARAYARGGATEEAALADLPGAWRAGADVGRAGGDVRVTLPVPALVPVAADWTLTVEAGASRDGRRSL